MNCTSIGERQPAPRTLTLTSQPASGGRGSGDSPGDHDDLKSNCRIRFIPSWCPVYDV
jgi:hypothetical protein